MPLTFITFLLLLNSYIAGGLSVITGAVGSVRTITLFHEASQAATQDGTAKVPHELKALRFEDNVRTIAFSPDGSMLAIGTDSKTVEVWRTATWERQQIFHPADLATSVTFSPDGKLLAGGSWREVRIWDVSTGKMKIKATGMGEYVESLSFSRRANTLVAGSMDNDVSLVDVDTGKVQRLITREKLPSNVTTFSPTSDILATAGPNNLVLLWKSNTWKQQGVLPAATILNHSVAFSYDGKLVAAGGDKDLTVWEIKDGKRLYSIPAHSDSIVSLSFSPDGNFIATGSFDKTFGIWSVKTGKAVYKSREFWR